MLARFILAERIGHAQDSVDGLAGQSARLNISIAVSYNPNSKGALTDGPEVSGQNQDFLGKEGVSGQSRLWPILAI